MSYALQGREGHVQAAVRAGPEGAQTVTVQVGVALQHSSRATASGPLPHQLGAPEPSGLKPILKSSLRGTVTVGYLELLPTHLWSRRLREAGDHTHREAVIGEKLGDSIAPLGGVGGQGRVSKETRQIRGGCDGLGSHIEVLGF